MNVLLHCAYDYIIINLTGLKIALGTKTVRGGDHEEFNSASKENSP